LAVELFAYGFCGETGRNAKWAGGESKPLLFAFRVGEARRRGGGTI